LLVQRIEGEDRGPEPDEAYRPPNPPLLTLFDVRLAHPFYHCRE